MSTSSIDNLSGYLQSFLVAAVQGTGSATNATANNLNGIAPSSLRLQPDTSQLSPFVQLVSELQQLQRSDPTKYQQVTQQIASNLENAAQTARANGNSAAANQLTDLATDFSKASTSSQLPNVQDLAKAVGGGHHHQHAQFTSDTDSGSGSSNSSTSGSISSTSSSGSLDTNLLLNQYLAGFQASGTQSDPQNPLQIILNTLSSAGINIPDS